LDDGKGIRRVKTSYTAIPKERFYLSDPHKPAVTPEKFASETKTGST